MQEGQITLESMNQAVWYNRWTVNWFKSFLRGTILEIGCGIGNFTNLLASYGNVYGIDIKKNYLTLAQKKAKKSSVGFGNIEQGKYFFNNQAFDTIVCLNVLEHIRNDNMALENIHKLLKKDGYLILLVPCHKSLYGRIDKTINHFRRYDKKELEQKLDIMGFNIIKSRRLNFLGALGWWFVGKILKENTVKENRIRLFNLIGPVFLSFEKIAEPLLGTSILIVAKKK